jgi:hypothetical protein
MVRVLLALVALLLVQAATASPVWLNIVRSGKGSGGIVSIGENMVNCGVVANDGKPGPTDCRVSVGQNIDIRLRASPHSGSKFVGWTTENGDCKTDSVFCAVRSRDKEFTVTARFEPNTDPTLFVSDMIPPPGSFLTVTTPSVVLSFNTLAIFIQAQAICADNHKRTMTPVPLDNVDRTAGASVWRLDFPSDDPVPLGAACTIFIRSNNAVIPKDKDKIFGKVSMNDQQLYIFNPDATLPSGGYTAHYTIANPIVNLSTQELAVETINTALPDAALTTAQTVNVQSLYRALVPLPATLVTSDRPTVNYCSVKVRVLASGVNIYGATGFPESTQVGTGKDATTSVVVNFFKQTQYFIVRSDSEVRDMQAFETLNANINPSRCYLILKEVKLAKRDLSAVLATEDSVVLIGPVAQRLIPQVDPPSPSPQVSPVVVSPPAVPTATQTATASPSPIPIIDWLVCAGTCRCPLTTAAARCVSDRLAAATVPGCNNPCVPSTTPSATPSPSLTPSPSFSSSISFSPTRSPPRKKRDIPSGFVIGLADIHLGISDAVPGTDVAVTTSLDAPNLVGLPEGYEFAGKHMNIQFLDRQNQNTRRFGQVTVGLEYRSLLFGSPADIAAGYALFAQSGRSARSWDKISFSFEDGTNRLVWRYTEPYEDFIFVRQVAIPQPGQPGFIPRRPDDDGPRNGATSGGSTTLFNDLTEPDDPTYGPVTPPTQYIGNFVPTPVPLVDNPFFTDRTFRLSPASFSLPSFLLLFVSAVVALFL